jgi:RND family efflux transporter MFP subunit
MRTHSTLESAKVKAMNAQAKAERQKQLIDQQLGSQEEYESAQTDAATALADQRTAEVAVAEVTQQEIALETKRQDVKLAEADVQAAQITLDQAKKQLDYTTVLAPMNGTVSSLDVQIGTIVASGINNVSGGTTIMTLSDLSHVFVEATVDEADIGSVQVGQSARVTVDSYAGKVFTGKVVRVAVKGVSESNVTTFEVKVEVTDAQKALLKPLMSANVVIVQAQRDGVLTLPTSAVTRKADKTVVKLSSGEEREIQLGIEGAERVEVTSGLAESDHVVVNNNEQPSRWRTQNQQQGPPG